MVPVYPIRSAAGIALAVDALRRGEIIAFPTDTLYGVGGDALSPAVVEAVLDAKRREMGKGLPVLLGDEAGASELAAVWPREAAALAASFWPGALTIVVQARAEVPAQVRLGDTVALRVPGLPALLTIIQKAGRPVIGTSANRSGEPPALTAQEAVAALGDTVRLVLDGGRSAGEPSTVVRVEKDSVHVLRVGAISEEALRAVLTH